MISRWILIVLIYYNSKGGHNHSDNSDNFTYNKIIQGQELMPKASSLELILVYDSREDQIQKLLTIHLKNIKNNSNKI